MTIDPRFAHFDRRPPAGLDDDAAPLSEQIEFMRLTDAIFRSFNWRQHPVGEWGLFRWSAVGPRGGVLTHSFAESYGDSPGLVSISIGNPDDCDEAPVEIVDNDLSLLCALVKANRDRGIGKLNVDALIGAMRRMCCSASGTDPEALPFEMWVALAGLWELRAEILADPSFEGTECRRWAEEGAR